MKIMTHIVAGYPTLKESEKIAQALIEAGTDLLEIQFPFSDPIADGPTIALANTESLNNGTTIDQCFKLTGSITKTTQTPVLIMTYYNIPFRYGLEKFCKKAKSLNVYGLIIPDMPIDEESHENYLQLCKKYDLLPIQVISPITPTKRLKLIAKVASGFVYCVSSFGTTGSKKSLPQDLKPYLSKVKKHISLPLAVGFGISKKSHIDLLSPLADIAVIGSKIINTYNSTPKNPLTKIKTFLSHLKT